MQIYELIPRVMEDIGAVSKSRKNEQQKYSFRGIEDFYQAAHPAMIKSGVFCAPKVLEREVYRFEKTNDQGRVTTWVHVALKVEHRFYAPDGSSVEVTTWGEGLDNSDKASNKAMSGAMKYALIELFCVPTQDVEDADRTSPETGVSRKPVERSTVRQESANTNGGHEAPLRDIPGGKDYRAPGDMASDAIDRAEREQPPKLITKDQAKKLHMRFREELREELKPKADKLLNDWLGLKLYLDEDGNPSALAIPAGTLTTVGPEAMLHARGL